MGSMLLGIILTIACVSLYADEIHKPIHKLQNHINDIMKGNISTVNKYSITESEGYSYSFYLAIVSILLSSGAASAMIMKEYVK